ncbi:tripartite tricarboxylate transporter TctB family protein [Alkalihalobacillus deserti]|uniref:tripartite tricarboxylate transporter TctB family protein n=1 Tax=Alkalihalobacillus deserti TaxID=2879466 RepID=UPI001D144BE7|nr:tripartite tricarboxylate transporter TctB family protein [Alkalihalobacillus deserti]
MDKKIVVKDTYIFLFIAVISLLFLVTIIPKEVQSGNPRLFPNLYAIGLFLVSLIMIIHMVVKKQSKSFYFDKTIFKWVGVNILIFFFYIFLIQYIGFFIMSIMFIIVMMRFLGEGWIISIILCVVLPGSIYFLFTKVLVLYFPSGILF